MAITPLPPLDPTDPQFKQKVDTYFLEQIPAFATEANALAEDVNAKQITASEAATTATTKAGQASTSAQTATDKADEAAATALNLAALDALWLGGAESDPATGKDGAPLVEGNAYVNSVTGYLRAYTGSEWVQGISAVAGVSSIDGEVGALALKTLNGNSLLGSGNIAIDSSIYRGARTSNIELVAADKGKLIDITSGTFTQTFDTVAALGDGWFCYLRNNGTGDITLTPNGAEQIDGLTGYAMYPGELRLMQCDGVELRSVVLNPFYKEYVASSELIRPPGYTAFEGLLWAGGGGGGRAGGTANSVGGGGGGACVPFRIQPEALSTAVVIAIGAGGSAAPAASSPGGAGGSSSFGSVTAFGGGGGGGSDVSVRNGGGGGGALSAGDTSQATSASSGGGPGGGLTFPNNSSSFGGGAGDTQGGQSFYGGGGGSQAGAGGKSVYGGGGGGGAVSTSGGLGGASVYGGSGGNGSGTTTAASGQAPSGGGGGSRVGNAGAGARGELRIWGVI